MSQIVRGLINKGLQEKLSRAVDLSLQRCIQICNASEIVRLQADERSGATNEATSDSEVYAIQRDQHTALIGTAETLLIHSYATDVV